MGDAFPQGLSQEYREAFDYFDKEKTGRVQPQDIGALMRSVGENLNDQQLSGLCGGQAMDFNAFIGYFQRKWEKASAFDELIEGFSFFDYSGNGTVRADDLRRLLTSIGQPLSNAEAEDLIREAGGDTIRYHEFATKLLSKGHVATDPLQRSSYTASTALL
ncbi:calmodulin [Planoprotostelium fungivorum]|uniref:Calmodulin n=1 Tax=Planoprotostelium fungivorum TaxID=1890364 RepID=A0A2P6NX87_9EUKA|nr:calmodulin [Planoprotostelium fungivorum]